MTALSLTQRRGSPIATAITLTLAAGISTVVHAQAAPGVVAVVTTVAPKIDGHLDDGVWGQAPVHVAVVSQPAFEASTPRRTGFQIAHDSRYVYIAGRFDGVARKDLRANALQRDRLGTDDVFRIVIDGYRDEENAVGFATSPSGVRADFAVARDGQSISYDWNAFWDVAVATSDSGWTAELRIPLSTLRYDVRPEGVTMGIIFTRIASTANEVQTFPAISPQFANGSFRPSRASPLTLTGIASQRSARLTPYALLGSEGASAGPAGGPFTLRENERGNAGFDLKVGVSSTLTMDLTANTDFAQAEADEEQVNLTRFSLFFPEKRQFFQEAAGVFEFNTGLGEAGRLFHSRRIGLTESGLPLRLRGGGRLVGRAAGFEVGALDIVADADGVDGSENLAALRIRRQSTDARRSLGFMATSRRGGRIDNEAVGIDASIRQGTNDIGTFQWAQTFDGGRAASALHGGMLRASWERRSSQGLVYRAGMRYVGRDHAPRLGFQPRTDFTQLEGNLRYGWYPGGTHKLEFLQPSLLVNVIRHNRRALIETARATQYLNFGTRTGVSGNVNVSGAFEDLPSGLTLAPGVQVPAGRHRFASAGASTGTPSGRPVRTTVFVGGGTFYDGTQRTASIVPSWTVSRHLELGAEYQVNRISFASRQQHLAADVGRLRIQTSLTPAISINTFVQYNRASRLVGGNARLRWHLSEGRDLFLVYNDRLNVEREELAFLPYRQARSMIAKVSWTVGR